MKYFKKINFIFLFGLCLSGLQAQKMYVSETNGIQTAHPLANIKRMTFPSGYLVVSSTIGIEDSYALNELSYLNFNDLTLSVAQPIQMAQQLFVYPNPVLDVLNISISDKSQLITNLETISIDGRMVQQQILNTKYQLHQVNVSGLPQGLYFCKINNDTTTQTIKFIKQ